jgi:hypothetical protein
MVISIKDIAPLDCPLCSPPAGAIQSGLQRILWSAIGRTAASYLRSAIAI